MRALWSARREHVAEHLEHALVRRSALHSSLRQAWRTRAAAASRSPCASSARASMKRPLAVDRLLLGEEGAHGAIVDAVVPQRVLGAAAEQRGSGASSDWRRRRRRSAGTLDWCCRERRITHSASLRATGSVMLASAALASASLPLRAASITRLTAAMSAAEVRSSGRPQRGRTPARQRFEVRAAFEKCAVQADIGLSI